MGSRRLVLAVCVLVSSFVCQAQDAYPANQYRPTVSVSTDLDLLRGFANFTITITAATNAHTIGGVASYEVRFGTSSTDRLGKQISVLSGSNLDSAMTIVYSGATRESSDSAFPTFINTFVLNSQNVANPSATSVTFTDKAVPLLTPLVSTKYNQRNFLDTNSARDVFFGELTVNLDSYTLEYNDTDSTLATITSYHVYPICDSSILSTLIWNGTYNSAASDMQVSGTANLTYDGTGCTNFANTFIVYAANSDGNSLSGVRFTLTDLVPSPTLTTDLDAGTSAYVTTYTPEKTLTNSNLNLNYGDYFKLEATWTETLRDEFSWKAYWYCGTRPVYYFDFGTSSNLGVPSSLTTLVASSGAQYASSTIRCLDGYSVLLEGTLSSNTSIATRGPETSRSAMSSAVVLNVTTDPTQPTWACPFSGPTATILADNVVGSISGSLTWTSNVATAYLSSATGRKPDYYVVYGSNDTTADSSDTRIKIVPYVEGQGTYTWTFTAIKLYNYMYVEAYESSGDGAITKCNRFTSQITEISVSTAPAGITSATFVDLDGNQNRIRGYVIAIVPSTLANGTLVQAFFATGSSSGDVNSATLLDAKIVTADVLTNAGGQTYVNLTVACDSNLLTANVAGQFGCNLYISATNVQYNYIQVYTVSDGLSSQPYSIRITDRNDPYTLLNEVYTYTGLFGGSGIKYYPTVQQTTSNNNLVSGKVTLTWQTANLAATGVNSTSGTVTLIDLSNVFRFDVVLGATSDTTPDCHLDPGWSAAPYPYDLTYPNNAYGGVENSTVSTANAFTTFSVVADYGQLVRCGFSPDTSNPLKIKGQMTQYVFTKATRQDSSGTFITDYIPQMTITAYVEITYLDSTHAAASGVSVVNVVVLDDVEEVVETDSVVRFYNPGFTSEKSSLNFMAKTEKMYVEHAITTNTQMFYVTLTRFWFAQEAFSTSQVELQVDSSDQAFTNVDSPVEKARFRFETTVPIVMNCRPCYMHLESKLSLDAPTTTSKKSLPGIEKFRPEKMERTSSSTALVIDVPEVVGSLSSGSNTVSTQVVITAVGTLVAARQIL